MFYKRIIDGLSFCILIWVQSISFSLKAVLVAGLLVSIAVWSYSWIRCQEAHFQSNMCSCSLWSPVILKWPQHNSLKIRSIQIVFTKKIVLILLGMARRGVKVLCLLWAHKDFGFLATKRRIHGILSSCSMFCCDGNIYFFRSNPVRKRKWNLQKSKCFIC